MKNISDLTLKEMKKYLSKIGDKEGAREIKQIIKKDPEKADLKVSETMDSQFNQVWKIKEHTYGFFDAANEKDGKIPLVNALTMDADLSLKGERINIRIGNIYVERYPGIFGGDHEILFEFKAKHSPEGSSEDESIQYTQKYTLRNKGGTGKSGLSVMKGLRVPHNGIDFYLNTIYLHNKNEEKFLKFLESGIFNSGLELIASVNPVLKQVSGYASGITQYLTDEKKSKIIQEIGLGFDFAGNSEVASLKNGTYVAIQAPRHKMNWSDWYYDKDSSLLKPYDDSLERMPYNHITFVISKYEEDVQ
ncbi:MAG: hypothetical protein HRT58_01030 [Crocinitomicaceae bacterium]|nr:hypothetical protein [Flavobacteriales bacterium]NQZ34205.1 hypothetical protein [Crocinitomicaceae bacterium]